MRQPAFLDFTEPVSGNYLVSRIHHRGEVPELGIVQWCGVLASLEEYAFHGGKVVLKSVIDA